MAEGFTETSTFRTQTGFALKVLGTTIGIVWSGAMIMASINALELEIERLKHEVDLNSEFRVKWPRGELGALPDDAEQNMRLTFLEKQIGKHEEVLDAMRYGVAE